MSERGDPYVYPGTTILFNRFDIKDGATLDKAERRFVAVRIEQGAPYGSFGLVHLQAIHHHLFQDGRTQLEYPRQLTEQAGHALNPSALEPDRWITASKASHNGDYAPMRQEILSAISNHGSSH